MIEKIFIEGELCGICVRSTYIPEGITFVTEKSESLQLGLMLRTMNDPVKLHHHHPVHRKIVGTSEFLLLRQGSCSIKIINRFESKIINMNEGDCILLLKGDHKIDFHEDTILLEIKQGPYLDGKDKEFLE